MKALSVSPDFALDILTGRKNYEYRSWDTQYRGRILICSTQKKIEGTIPGHALITCEIINTKKIAANKFAWKLDNFIAIKPFAVKGQQRFFEVDDNLIEFAPFTDEQEAEAEEFFKKYFMPLFV